jgi:hypothetical protein
LDLVITIENFISSTEIVNIKANRDVSSQIKVQENEKKKDHLSVDEPVKSEDLLNCAQDPVDDVQEY